MPFELFTQTRITRDRRPSATLNARGRVGFNKAADALMGHPDYIELLYDPDARRIGFRPVGQATEHSYMVTRHGRKSKSGADESRSIGIGSFLMYYGLKHAGSMRYLLSDVGDGIYAIDLNDPTALRMRNADS